MAEKEQQEVLLTVDALFSENKAAEAENYMLKVLKKAKEEKDEDLLFVLYSELIGYYRMISAKENLLSIIDEAFTLLRERGEENSLRYGTMALNAATGYRSIGMLAEAEAYYGKAETIYENAIKNGEMQEADLRLAGLYNNKSLLFQEQKRLAEAIAYQKRALQMVTLAKAEAEIAVTHANLAGSYVLTEEYARAKDHALEAIRLFKAKGMRDAHYAAALSALGTCAYEEGNLTQAQTLYQEALLIIEAYAGKSSQYERVQEYIARCEQKESKSYKNGMELSKAYYETYGKPMLQEKFADYIDKIAVGLVGKGSDCYGFDDALSMDHDYGADFCMWLSDETYEAIGKQLQEEYDKLPAEFGGVKRTTLSKKQRRGVFKISAFYKNFLGTASPDEIDYTQVEDYNLSGCVNGEVFTDAEGTFSAIRQKLQKGYPERMRLLKIAEAAAKFSQCAQYNFARFLEREDESTAFTMLSDGLKYAMKLAHYLENQYPPHDKWLFKSAGMLPGGVEVRRLADQIINQFLTKADKKAVKDAVEQLAEYFVHRMYAEGIISDVNPYLDYHTEELLTKAQLCTLTKQQLVQKIVLLEFEAFDKVQNEGGRANCQDNFPTFSVMRSSQYLTWDETMLRQYYYDFDREYNLGHNLITEKYGRMMESTASDRYEEIKAHFPYISPEKKALIEQIVALQMQMMETFAKEHPKTAGNARSLHTYEDNIVNTSYETYLRGEISTYSDKMLELYGRYVVTAFQNGENIAKNIMENTAKLYGFKSLEEFEK